MVQPEIKNALQQNRNLENDDGMTPLDTEIASHVTVHLKWFPQIHLITFVYAVLLYIYIYNIHYIYTTYTYIIVIIVVSTVITTISFHLCMYLFTCLFVHLFDFIHFIYSFVDDYWYCHVYYIPSITVLIVAVITMIIILIIIYYSIL